MSAVRTPESRPQSRSRNHIVILIDAVAWATRLRLTVLPSVEGHGVRYQATRTRHAWVRDHRFAEVDPFGCALLVERPQTSDPQLAIVMALGGPSWEVLGAIGLGLEGKPQPELWEGREDEYDLRKGHEGGACIRLSLLAARPRRTATPVEA